MANLQQHIQPSDDEITDLFCGCGGSSEGASNVPGVRVRLAMNHWKLAIESHSANHPNTDHDCADISNTDPRRYRRTNMLIASPECTKHSPAGGRRRKNGNQGDLFLDKAIDPSVIRSRATMWDVCNFTEIHRYETIIVENVVEVMEWIGFEHWLGYMKNVLGYEHKLVFLNAMFAHGPGIANFAPQSRDRIYIVFWKKGNRAPNLNITPAAPCYRCGCDVASVQAFKPGGSPLKKYKTQYVYQCPRCRAEVKPYYYAAINALDFSVPITRIRDRKGGPKEPILSANTMNRIAYGLEKFGYQPTIMDCRNSSEHKLGARVKAAMEGTMNTQSTGYSTYLFSPFVLDTSHSHAQHNGKVRDMVGEALMTGTTQQSSSLVLPEVFVQSNRTHSPMANALQGPLNTEATNYANYVAMPEVYVSADRADTPLRDAAGREMPGITTTTAPSIVMPAGGAIGVHHGTSLAQGLAQALNTQTQVNKSSVLLTPEMYRWVQSMGFVQPYHGGSDQASSYAEAFAVIATKSAMHLTEPRGAIDIQDCYWRMLRAHETKRGQGFPKSYVVLGSQADQQKQIGNANPPNTMELLIQRCHESLS